MQNQTFSLAQEKSFLSMGGLRANASIKRKGKDKRQRKDKNHSHISIPSSFFLSTQDNRSIDFVFSPNGRIRQHSQIEEE